jgi:hypothetical protein
MYHASHGMKRYLAALFHVMPQRMRRFVFRGFKGGKQIKPSKNGLILDETILPFLLLLSSLVVFFLLASGQGTSSIPCPAFTLI